MPATLVVLSYAFSPPEFLPEAHIRVELSSPGTTVSPDTPGLAPGWTAAAPRATARERRGGHGAG